jgi:hypothetical protein
MGRKQAHTPEEIVAKLRQAEVLIAQGKTVADAVRAIGVTEPTYYRMHVVRAAWIPQSRAAVDAIMMSPQ